jgi:hypothetical protein
MFIQHSNAGTCPEASAPAAIFAAGNFSTNVTVGTSSCEFIEVPIHFLSYIFVNSSSLMTFFLKICEYSTL